MAGNEANTPRDGKSQGGTNVKRHPFSLVAGHDIRQTANALRDLADEIELRPSVRGVIVLVDAGGNKFDTIFTGRYSRARDRVAVALLKVAHWIIHDE